MRVVSHFQAAVFVSVKMGQQADMTLEKIQIV